MKVLYKDQITIKSEVCYTESEPLKEFEDEINEYLLKPYPIDNS